MQIPIWPPFYDFALGNFCAINNWRASVEIEMTSMPTSFTPRCSFLELSLKSELWSDLGVAIGAAIISCWPSLSRSLLSPFDFLYLGPVSIVSIMTLSPTLTSLNPVMSTSLSLFLSSLQYDPNEPTLPSLPSSPILHSQSIEPQSLLDMHHPQGTEDINLTQDDASSHNQKPAGCILLPTGEQKCQGPDMTPPLGGSSSVHAFSNQNRSPDQSSGLVVWEAEQLRQLLEIT